MADIRFIPGVHPTYRQQFDKITEAYIKGEIQPFNVDFCFCGTLACGRRWTSQSPYLQYSSEEFGRMEEALLTAFHPIGLIYLGFCSAKTKSGRFISEEIPTHPLYEDCLFTGTSAALDVLKQIHIEHGEIIDEVPAFTKRELKTA